MQSVRWPYGIILPLALAASLSVAEAQGKGKGGGGGGHGHDNKPQQAQGRGEGRARGGGGVEQGKGDRGKDEQVARSNRGRGGGAGAGDLRDDRKEKQEVFGGDIDRARSGPSAGRGRGRFMRELALVEIKPATRRFVISDRLPERVAGGAVAHAIARGLRDDDLFIVPSNTRVLVRNRSGDVLFDLDDEHARNLGVFRVVPVDDEVRSGAPSFCRSGAGHPVWGREWCLQKGFGLGGDNVRWGRAVDPTTVVFRRVDDGAITNAVLREVLGDVILNRLAVHAVTLGLVDPLTGLWLGEPSGNGSQVLLLRSGDVPVAEIVDVNRDRRADSFVIALRPW
jgi:hypothetical protein